MWSFLKESKEVIQKINGHARHKRNTIKITYKRKSYTLSEFADLAKVPYMTMYMRAKNARTAGDLQGENLIRGRKRGRPVEA